MQKRIYNSANNKELKDRPSGNLYKNPTFVKSTCLLLKPSEFDVFGSEKKDETQSKATRIHTFDHSNLTGSTKLFEIYRTNYKIQTPKT